MAACLMLIAIFSERCHELYLYEYKGSSIVLLTGLNGGSATGFQVQAASGELFIMTNRHVCDGLVDKEPVVMYEVNGFLGMSSVVYRDTKADLCLLEPATGIRPLDIASKVYGKEKLALIGYPGGRGLSYETGFFVENTMIPIANYCYDNIKELCDYHYETYHINVISYGGNSGSPILDVFGNVVAVLFAGRRDQPTATHAVPLTEIQRVLEAH